MAWYDSFDDMVSADLESSFFGDSEFADSVVVTQRDDKPRKIRCQVVETTAVIREGSHSESIISAINVLAKDDPLLGIVDPIVGDSVLWNERNWDFLSVKSADLKARICVFTETNVTHRGHNRPPTI